MKIFVINGFKCKFYINKYNSEINFFYLPIGWVCRKISNGKISWVKYDFLYGFCKYHPEAANYLDKYVKNIAFI